MDLYQQITRILNSTLTKQEKDVFYAVPLEEIDTINYVLQLHTTQYNSDITQEQLIQIK